MFDTIMKTHGYDLNFPHNYMHLVDDMKIPEDTIKVWFSIVHAVRYEQYHFDFILDDYKSEPTIEDCQKMIKDHNFNPKNFISYIKVVRLMNGMGLADAKAYCETKLGLSMQYVP